jgi:hypothetical protein
MRADRWEAENITIGGLPLTPLKNEYGARLGVPSGASVEIHAIGRGTMLLSSSLCTCLSGRSCGAAETILYVMLLSPSCGGGRTLQGIIADIRLAA